MRYRDIRGRTDPGFTAAVVTYFDTAGQLTEAGRRWQADRSEQVARNIRHGRRLAVRRSLVYAGVFMGIGLLMWPNPADWSDASARVAVVLLWGIVAAAVTWDRTSRRRRPHERWLQQMQAAELSWARVWAGQSPQERDTARRTWLAVEGVKLTVKGTVKVASKVSGIAWDVYGP